MDSISTTRSSLLVPRRGVRACALRRDPAPQRLERLLLPRPGGDARRGSGAAPSPGARVAAIRASISVRLSTRHGLARPGARLRDRKRRLPAVRRSCVSLSSAPIGSPRAPPPPGARARTKENLMRSLPLLACHRHRRARRRASPLVPGDAAAGWPPPRPPPRRTWPTRRTGRTTRATASPTTSDGQWNLYSFIPVDRDDGAPAGDGRPACRSTSPGGYTIGDDRGRTSPITDSGIEWDNDRPRREGLAQRQASSRTTSRTHADGTRLRGHGRARRLRLQRRRRLHASPTTRTSPNLTPAGERRAPARATRTATASSTRATSS